MAEVARGASAARRADVESDAHDLVAQGFVDPSSILTEDQSFHISLVFPIGVGPRA